MAGVDLVRDGDGNWCVLEDNLRVPSGIGYAMQNRRLTEAVLPELPRPDDAAQHRGDAAAAASGPCWTPPGPAAGDDPAVVVLSQGPDDSAWFEHRMLAEEMGVPLVRSTELLVDDGRVHRLDERPQAPRSTSSTCGWARTAWCTRPARTACRWARAWSPALHADTVVLANALGNGIGDDKAVYAYVPKLIEYYLGEKPLLADVPTYLCGIAGAARRGAGPARGAGLQAGRRLRRRPDRDRPARQRARTWPPCAGRSAPPRTAGWRRRSCDLSTHPVFDGHQLAPRHVDLRAFVFTGRASVVAPAALTRVAPAGSMIVNSSRGGGVEGHLAAGLIRYCSDTEPKSAAHTLVNLGMRLRLPPRRFRAMCGIGGELRFDGRAADAEAVRRMLPCLESRGPDGEGLWQRGPVALGHRRLKIIDLSEAGAPADGRRAARPDPGLQRLHLQLPAAARGAARVRLHVLLHLRHRGDHQGVPPLGRRLRRSTSSACSPSRSPSTPPAR